MRPTRKFTLFLAATLGVVAFIQATGGLVGKIAVVLAVFGLTAFWHQAQQRDRRRRRSFGYRFQQAHNRLELQGATMRLIERRCADRSRVLRRERSKYPQLSMRMELDYDRHLALFTLFIDECQKKNAKLRAIANELNTLRDDRDFALTLQRGSGQLVDPTGSAESAAETPGQPWHFDDRNFLDRLYRIEQELDAFDDELREFRGEIWTNLQPPQH